MAPVGRLCTECGTPLAGKSVSAKTCSDKCRNRRSRRLARGNRQVDEFQQRNNAAASEVAALVRTEAAGVIPRVIGEQLAPIVREALTEDVLRSINDMVGLTPLAVAALQDDLTSEDRILRQRAYTQLMKFTVGHPALVRPTDAEPHGDVTVNFNLPRPEAPAVEAPPDAEAVEELKTCDYCGEAKPPAEFESGSDRCKQCFVDLKTKITEQFS